MSTSKTAAAAALAMAALLAGACDSREGTHAASAAREQQQAAPAAGGAGAAESEGEVRRITVDEARKALEDGAAVVLDVRGQSAYDAKHIEGAKSLPGNELEERLAEVPKDKLVITYCA